MIPVYDDLDSAAREMSESLASIGVVKIKDYLSGDMLERLNEEFQWVLCQGVREGIKPIYLDCGGGANVRQYEIGGTLPATRKVFSADWMQKVSDTYWGDKALLNDQIYVMREVVGTEHVAQDLHFDVQRTLKFFVYLNDVTLENGAFSCVPGSHHLTESMRESLGEEISYKNRHLTREHPYTESDIVPVEGAAGSLIVFTTDVWHRAGIVRTGERQVMRGHTRPAPRPTIENAETRRDDGRESIVARMMSHIRQRRK